MNREGLLRARKHMHWYNPRLRRTEKRPTPQTNEEALTLLDGDPSSELLIVEYEKLRAAGMDIEGALAFTGHAFRSKHLLYQPPN